MHDQIARQKNGSPAVVHVLTLAAAAAVSDTAGGAAAAAAVAAAAAAAAAAACVLQPAVVNVGITAVLFVATTMMIEDSNDYDDSNGTH